MPSAAGRWNPEGAYGKPHVMTRTKVGVLTWVVLLSACGGSEEYVASSNVPRAEVAPEEGGDAWPRELVTVEGSGPALYLREDTDSPAVGYVSAGVALRVAGIAPQRAYPSHHRRTAQGARVVGAVEARGTSPTSRSGSGNADVYRTQRRRAGGSTRGRWPSGDGGGYPEVRARRRTAARFVYRDPSG